MGWDQPTNAALENSLRLYGSVQFLLKSEVEVGKIYHVVGIIDGDSEGLNGKLLLYVNGKLVDEEGGVGLLYSLARK